MSENKHQQGRAEHDAQSLSATEQQATNAAGANNNEQGQATFITGSTTAGGSNYGQGSHQLGGESYRQGNTANSGANYSNESGKLGASSTGTSAEGSSSATIGAAQSDRAGELKSTAVNALNYDIGAAAEEEHGQADSRQKNREEDECNDTDLEQSSGLGSEGESSLERRASGSWSRSSADQ